MENPIAIPSSDLYLNHLPANKATQAETARDVYLVILGIAVWDVLLYIPEDYRIVSKGFNAVTFCFIFSRFFAIAYALTFVYIQTYTVANCEAASIVMNCFCIFSMLCSSFLFLRRLHAIYAHGRMIRWIFTLLWIGTVACGIPVLTGFHMEHIPGTVYCAPYKVEDYLSIAVFFPGAFDTLVCFAISYRVITTHGGGSGKLDWRKIIMGKTLPRLSRALLHSGQQYYLIVFAITIITGATLYAPGALSTSYHPVLTLLRTVLIASMASRAFRSVKTFQVNHQSFLPVTTPIRFNEPPLSEDNGYSTGMRTMPQESQQPSSDEVLIISRNPEMSEFCRSSLIMSQDEAMI